MGEVWNSAKRLSSDFFGLLSSKNYFNRVLKCDVIKMKFLKLWDFSVYSKGTMSKRPTCQVLTNFLILSCCTFWLKFLLVYSLANVFILLKEQQQWPGSEPTHFLADAFDAFAALPVFCIHNLLLSPHHFAAVPESNKRGKYKNLAHKLMWG